jgi:ornithine lipid ester-linked acyl 2-hydroxylase
VGVKFHSNLKKFPLTTKIINQIPGLVSASFNVLESNAEINPHFGDTNGIVRAHLGLLVPGTLPKLGFQVNLEQRTWEEGKLLLFCDGYPHRAWNYTKEKRIILLLDVIRPEFTHKKRTICGTVLASLFFQAIIQRLSFLKIIIAVPFFALIQLAKFSAILLTPLYNFISREISKFNT